jgi:predicted CXXCH cytochrome family protein
MARVTLALAVAGVSLAGARSDGQVAADIAGTKHNLSVTGPGQLRAVSETRICVFCHTPHNATPASPLWNRAVEPQVYTVYSSPTLRAAPLPQPTGPTRLCLTCHDGMIAMSAVLQPAGGIRMRWGGRFPPGSRADFAANLSAHHPVSFPYSAALPNPELKPAPPAELDFGGTGELHCITCHDPHDDQFGRFLVQDNRFSALCIACHEIPGWAGSAHAISTTSVAGILPRPPQQWPAWTQLGEWGCESCHAPHRAPTAQKLLLFSPGVFDCTTTGCHATAPAAPHSPPSAAEWRDRIGRGGTLGERPDIGRQIQKLSAHRRRAGGEERSSVLPGEGARSVSCVDCHNPHATGAGRGNSSSPAAVRLAGVAGVDRNGAALPAANHEYEVCFKCHGDYSSDVELVPRVVSSTNTRRDFDPLNPSYHPVVAMGRDLDVPSIPSTREPGMTPSELIPCTACHADDEGGARGPHGSQFRPILRSRYETSDGTRESFESFSLCYRCHERSSILSDSSFAKKASGTTATRGGHSGHLAAGASCATCHDPHGVSANLAAGAATGAAAGGGATGDHRHLINFDTRVVLPLPGAPYPVFRSAGTFSGSCALVCHGVVHQSARYP